MRCRCVMPDGQDTSGMHRAIRFAQADYGALPMPAAASCVSTYWANWPCSAVVGWNRSANMYVVGALAVVSVCGEQNSEVPKWLPYACALSLIHI